jgi:hypothetical protein
LSYYIGLGGWHKTNINCLLIFLVFYSPYFSFMGFLGLAACNSWQYGSVLYLR